MEEPTAAASPSVGPAPEDATPEDTSPEVVTTPPPVGVTTERRVKVDPDVAYESGLCKQCKPTKPSSWSSGALFWMQVAFFSLVFILILLMLTAIYLCNLYINQHSCTRVINRRKSHHH